MDSNHAPWRQVLVSERQTASERRPAIERANGDKEWYLNDKLHRTNGPAFEWANGNKQWYLKGKLHRTDGPAIEWVNGWHEWFLNGVEQKKPRND
jgi:hypothetical protein